MRCEYSKVVCDGKVMALLTKWKKSWIIQTTYDWKAKEHTTKL
jgi:hypothetical protein